MWCTVFIMWKVHWSTRPGHGTKKNPSPWQQLNPQSHKHQVAALSTELRELMETMVISPDLEWPGKHVRQKQQTSHQTSCWALCCHAYIAHITWLLSYSKLFLCYFRQGFHRFWKHFGSWNFFGKWPIIVLAFSVGKKEKKCQFLNEFLLKNVPPLGNNYTRWSKAAPKTYPHE